MHLRLLTRRPEYADVAPRDPRAQGVDTTCNNMNRIAINNSFPTKVQHYSVTDAIMTGDTHHDFNLRDGTTDQRSIHGTVDTSYTTLPCTRNDPRPGQDGNTINASVIRAHSRQPDVH